MLSLKTCPNVGINGQSLFRKAIDTFGFTDEALWRKTADSYEKAVEKLFIQIEGTATGRAVLRAIARTSPRTMLIQPLLETNGGRPNAYAKVQDLKAARREGCDAMIFFTPAHWQPSAIAPLYRSIQHFYGPGAPADEVLLHEVVHGLRHMAGLRMRRNVPFQIDYDTFEEFYAILIANIYRSEQGRPNLRTDHRGFQPLASKGIHTSTDFYNHRLNKLHIAKLGRQQPTLFSDLSHVKATFNPIMLAASP